MVGCMWEVVCVGCMWEVVCGRLCVGGCRLYV